MERSFLDYAMSVITARALPDVRDGLKPVHRRILYGMYDGRPAARPQAPEVGVGRRRRDGQVPPARRRRDLRRAGPHGPGLLAPVPARRRPRELRLARPQRPPGRGPLHRGAAGAARDAAARRDRRGHRRLRADLRRQDRASRSCCRRGSRTCSSTAAAASRSAWPPTSRRTTSARSSTRRMHLLDNPDATATTS